MIKLLSIFALIAHCFAYYGSYGGGGYSGGGYGSSPGIIPAAVQSDWRLDVRPVQIQRGQIQPQMIEVPPIEMPVKIVYNSKSSGVFVQQVHQPGEPGQTESTKSEEEPHRLSHEVIRPVIQELREVIIPYRRIVQEIAPVVEDVQTIVARGEDGQNTSPGPSGGVLPSIISGIGGGGANIGGALGAVGGGLGKLYGQRSGVTGAITGSGRGGYRMKTAVEDLSSSGDDKS